MICLQYSKLSLVNWLSLLFSLYPYSTNTCAHDNPWLHFISNQIITHLLSQALSSSSFYFLSKEIACLAQTPPHILFPYPLKSTVFVECQEKRGKCCRLHLFSFTHPNIKYTSPIKLSATLCRLCIRFPTEIKKALILFLMRRADAA